MKKNIAYFAGLLILAGAFIYIVYNWLSGYEHPGYVLIGFGHWSLETTVVVFTVSMIIGFFTLYAFFRLLGILVRLPRKMVKSSQTKKANRSQNALISGLVDSAAGNWEQAEKVLDFNRQRRDTMTKAEGVRRDSMVEQFKGEWGANYDKNIAASERALEAFGDDNLREVLEKTGLSHEPSIVNLFFKLSQKISEDSFVDGGGGGKVNDARPQDSTGKAMLSFPSMQT